jgi:hypothetical protein
LPWLSVSLGHSYGKKSSFREKRLNKSTQFVK